MKFTCLFDCVYCFCCYFAVIIFSIILETQKISWICSKSHIIHLSDGEQMLRRNTNHCDINARPPVNSNGKEGVAMKQSR